MTTLHPAPGEARPGDVIVDGQVPPVDQDSVDPDQIVISRRKLLWWLGGSAGAVVLGGGGAATWYFTRPRGSTGTAAPLHPGNGKIDGSTGANVNPGGNDEAGKEVIPVNVRNPNHIKDVMLGDPVLQGRVRTFMGTENITLIPPGVNNHFPWLQVTTPAHENLTLTLRPTGVDTAPGERVPTWAQLQATQGFDRSAWTTFEGGTVVRVNDQYPRLTMATVTGYANLGTAEEHRFTIETEHLARLSAMDAAGRRAEFMGLTSAMLGARAMG